MLEVISVASDTLSLDDVKKHLIVEHNEDDTLIQMYIDASLEAVEQQLHKKTRVVSYRKTLKNFDDRVFWESSKPLAHITVTYNTTEELVLNEYDYNYDRDGDTNYYSYVGNDTIELFFNDKPSDWDGLAFKAEYESGSSVVSSVVTQARLLLIGTWYEQRASVSPKATKILSVPHTVEFLLSPYQDVAL